MNQQPQLLEEPPVEPIQPSLKFVVAGSQHEYQNKWSFKTLKDLEDDDVDAVDGANGAISEVRKIESSTDTTEIKNWIIEKLHNNTHHNLVKFHILAVVFDRHCKIVVSQGGYQKWQFEEDEGLIDAINENCNTTHSFLRLGQVH